MFSLFMLLPLTVCVYEILSFVLPLKFPAWAKILLALLLFSGLAKNFLLHRTASGFEIYELPYIPTLIISILFNLIIVALFMVIVKDIFCKIFLPVKFPAHYASLFVLTAAFCATLYGTYEALRQPDINTHEIHIPGLGRELDGFRVAVLVDIHADPLTNREFVSKLVERTNALKPDVILMPGDFVDGTVRDRLNDLEPLSQLKAPVYGTTGNHEYYYDFSGWIKKLPELGVNILTNEHAIISSGDAKLIIAGLPDHTSGMMGIEPRDISRTLEGVPEGVPVILMDHQPRDARTNAEHNVALQVSGHTHGGQMPGIYTLVKRANAGFVRGWYDVDGMKLYVSPGTSQWNGFSCRILDPAEITLFVLKSM